MKRAGTRNKELRYVMLIVFDSLRSDYAAKLTSNVAPNLCLMRDTGVFFENMISQAPFTVPSCASMLTGLYPARTCVRDMHHRLPSEVPSVFTILREHGFFTLSVDSTPMLLDRGFGDINKRLPLSIRELVKSIEGNASNRSFVFVHYWDTHTPYCTKIPIGNFIDILLNLLRPMDRFKNMKGLRRLLWRLWLLRVKRLRSLVQSGDRRIRSAIEKGYKDAILDADRFLGRLLRMLEMRNLADETLIIVTADHGDSFNEHNEINWAAGGCYEHGQSLYDNVIRVPLIFYSPNKVVAQAYDCQVQLVDVIPTILEALQIDYDGFLDGTSLWKAIKGEASPPRTEHAYSEVVRESLNLDLRCVRSELFKLIFDHKSENFELYDLRKDPEEMRNVWSEGKCEEKNKLLSALDSFSEIEQSVVGTNAASDEEEIEKALRGLGYL